MPLDVTPKNFRTLNSLYGTSRNEEWFSNSFDMGSLKEIYQYFPAEEEGPFY